MRVFRDQCTYMMFSMRWSYTREKNYYFLNTIITIEMIKDSISTDSILKQSLVGLLDLLLL